MKVIQTKYRDCHFRSRLEARWAVFFDELHIEWEYEPEGFVCDDGTWYLPDFYLPRFNGGLYVEVKREGGDLSKARSFGRENPLLICEGLPGMRVYTMLDPLHVECDVVFSRKYLFGGANADEHRLYMHANKGEEEFGGEIVNKAVTAAKSKRFEFEDAA